MLRAKRPAPLVLCVTVTHVANIPSVILAPVTKLAWIASINSTLTIAILEHGRPDLPFRCPPGHDSRPDSIRRSPRSVSSQMFRPSDNANAHFVQEAAYPSPSPQSPPSSLPQLRFYANSGGKHTTSASVLVPRAQHSPFCFSATRPTCTRRHRYPEASQWWPSGRYRSCLLRGCFCCL